jgi:hypothetical protein
MPPRQRVEMPWVRYRKGLKSIDMDPNDETKSVHDSQALIRNYKWAQIDKLKRLSFSFKDRCQLTLKVQFSKHRTPASYNEAMSEDAVRSTRQ